jgi:hypothetical protein
MALIETGAREVAPPSGGHLFAAGDADFVLCRGPEKLKMLLKHLQPGKTTYYLSDGDFSMQDMVIELLKRYRPAELYISTYSLREFAVRQLILAKDRGDIISMSMLLDYRASVRTPQVYQMAKENFASIYMISIHAKITVIKSAAGSVVIVGSQNWTVNPKIESGTVSLNEKLADWYIEHFKKIMSDAKVFE